mgnify:CR=1 FL=1
MKIDIRKKDKYELYILVFNNINTIQNINMNYINNKYIYSQKQLNILNKNLILLDGYYI